MQEKFYLTTAIDYVNGAPHIGHAYEKILTDVIYRHFTQRCDNTFFLTGTDEHGQKIQEKAGKGFFIALLLFVGIPLPGTGAWTGTLAASLLGLSFKETVISVILGVLLAGLIMMAGSFGLFSALFAISG